MWGMGQSAMEDVATKAPPRHYRVSRATAESTLIWTRASSNSPPGSLKKAPFRLLDDWSEKAVNLSVLVEVLAMASFVSHWFLQLTVSLALAPLILWETAPGGLLGLL